MIQEESRYSFFLKAGAGIFFISFAALHIIGSFFTSGLLWGFNYFAFLSPLLMWGVLGLGVVFSLLCLRGGIDKGVSTLAQFMEDSPFLFYSIVASLFIIVAIIFQVKAPLLGDSFVIIMNYENQIAGTKDLWAFRSPLAVHYFFAWMKMLNTMTYPSMLTSFLCGELLLGAGFLLCVLFIVRELFDDKVERLIAYLFLVTMPYMQLFFGYVEIYAVFLFAMSVLILSVLLYLKGRVSLVVVTIAFLFSLFSHFMTLVVCPALAYLLYLEYKKSGLKIIGISTGIVIGLFFAVFAASNFDLKRFVSLSPYSYFLTITPANIPYQAYTMFSPFHFTEMLNLLILVCPIALFLILFTLIVDAKVFWKTHEARFFSISAVSVFLFMFTVRFDLGVAKDWDVSSSFMLLISLLALLVIFQFRFLQTHRALLSLIVIGMASIGPWFYLNSTREPSVKRMESLFDTRVLSADSYYLLTMHLGRYFSERRDIGEVRKVMDRYLHQYPDNNWVHQMYVNVMGELLGQTHPEIEDVYKEWVRASPADTLARSSYAAYLMKRGTEYLQRGLTTQAENDLKSATLIDTTVKTDLREFSPDFIRTKEILQKISALNNLGLVYFNQNEYDKALDLFRQALILDPTYVPAYVNIGNIYLNQSKPATAIFYYDQALKFDDTNISAYESLSKALYRSGKQEMALAALQQAARLGSATAQSILQQSGQSW